MSGSRDLDRLLDGAPSEKTPLSELVSALRAPDQPEEVAGLNAAMAAFFRVGPGSRPTAFIPPAPQRRARVRKGLLLKLGTLIGGASVVGGVALAAQVVTGHQQPQHAPAGPAGSETSNHASATAAGESTALRTPPSKHGRSGRASVPGRKSRSTAISVSAPGFGATGSGSGSDQSTHPTRPSHPAHPSHPAEPSHPTHPSHPSHPTPKASSSPVLSAPSATSKNTKTPPGLRHRPSKTNHAPAAAPGKGRPTK